MQDLNFDGRVAVITGAGRGLGRSYALLLASRGAKVVVNDTGSAPDGEGADRAAAEQVVDEIRAAGGQAVSCAESVATPQGGGAIVRAALETYGRIDILIHNAGNARHALLRDMTQEEFDAVLDVHQRGAFHVVRPAFASMCDAGYGRIVLTSSICGVYGCMRDANYATAKTGMIGLSNVAAIEGAEHGVKCNVILPAAVTRLAEARDLSGYPPMTADMVAPVVGWLAHEDCSVSGEMYASIAGRVARAFVAEAPGVYLADWTIEDVRDRIDAIRDADRPVVFPVTPAGSNDHIRYSFEMSRRGGPA